jgi:hypothetical protein
MGLKDLDLIQEPTCFLGKKFHVVMAIFLEYIYNENLKRIKNSWNFFPKSQKLDPNFEK